MKKPLFLSLFISAALLLPSAPALAQAYPNRPVELVVSFQPGGGVDTMARLFAEAARPHFSQPIVVVNRPGASGAIGLSYVATSPADGHRVAMTFAELLTLPLLGTSKIDHEDFQPIAKFTSDPSTVTVRAEAPWKTLEEFLEYARANPLKVNVSHAGNGSISHISGAALGLRARAVFTHVPYQGSAPAVQALLGGQVDATAVNYSVVSPFVASGKLRVLASMSAQRLEAIPQVPTLKERGIDLALDAWRGMAVPKDTPKPIVEALQRLAVVVSRDPKLVEALRKQNQTLQYEDAQEFSRTLAEQSGMFKALMPQLRLNVN